MTIPHATLADLNAVATAISHAKSSAHTQWSLSATLGSKPQTAVTLAIQAHPPGTRALEWAKLHFASHRDAAQWLALVCSWTMASRRAEDATAALPASLRADRREALLGPLRHALESTATIVPNSVQIHQQGPSEYVRRTAAPADFSSQGFAFSGDAVAS